MTESISMFLYLLYFFLFFKLEFTENKIYPFYNFKVYNSAAALNILTV